MSQFSSEASFTFALSSILSLIDVFSLTAYSLVSSLSPSLSRYRFVPLTLLAIWRLRSWDFTPNLNSHILTSCTHTLALSLYKSNPQHQTAESHLLYSTVLLCNNSLKKTELV